MVSPKKWYKPNPYKSASDGSSFGKTSIMVLLLVVQAILCSLYLYYGETSHDYGSSSNGITTLDNNDDAPSHVVVVSSVKDDTTTNDNNNDGGRIILHYKKPTKRYTRTMYTRDNFIVNGVNLAKYSFENGDDLSIQTIYLHNYFGLFQDFSLESMLHQLVPTTTKNKMPTSTTVDEDDNNNNDESTTESSPRAEINGNTYNELYVALYNLRHDLKHLSLSFYGDKVASQRARLALGVPQARKHVLLYKHELNVMMGNDDKEKSLDEIHALIPTEASYVAKSSHLSCSW